MTMKIKDDIGSKKISSVCCSLHRNKLVDIFYHLSLFKRRMIQKLHKCSRYPSNLYFEKLLYEHSKIESVSKKNYYSFYIQVYATI